MVKITYEPFTIWISNCTNRNISSGSATFSSLLVFLERELRYLSATNVLLSTGHRRTDLKQDGFPKSNAQMPFHPGVIVSFDFFF